MGKMQRKPFPALREVRSKRRLQLVHSDVCGPVPTESIGGTRTLSFLLMTTWVHSDVSGPMPTESIDGNKYFVTFVDDYTICCAVYFLKSKIEVQDKFKQFERLVVDDSCQNIALL